MQTKQPIIREGKLKREDKKQRIVGNILSEKICTISLATKNNRRIVNLLSINHEQRVNHYNNNEFREDIKQMKRNKDSSTTPP